MLIFLAMSLSTLAFTAGLKAVHTLPFKAHAL